MVVRLEWYVQSNGPDMPGLVAEGDRVPECSESPARCDVSLAEIQASLRGSRGSSPAELIDVYYRHLDNPSREISRHGAARLGLEVCVSNGCMTRWMRQGTPRGAGLPGCRFFCWRENWAKLTTNSIISAMSVGMHSSFVSHSAARVVVIMAGLVKRAIDSSTGVRRGRGRSDGDRKRCSVSVGLLLAGPTSSGADFSISSRPRRQYCMLLPVGTNGLVEILVGAIGLGWTRAESSRGAGWDGEGLTGC